MEWKSIDISKLNLSKGAKMKNIVLFDGDKGIENITSKLIK